MILAPFLIGANKWEWTPEEPVKEYFLEVARGNIPDQVIFDKFGRSTNVDNGITTDIWDRANAVDDQDIWIAPTAARVHAIVSGSASDDQGGVGARTLRIYGLTSWTTKEVTEEIALNGTSSVNTSNSYVIIYRMEVLTKGATNVNVGVITATAASDATVTAQINVGEGQTQMAIFGIPSIQTAYMTNFYVSFNKSGGATGVIDVSLRYNPEPDVELTNFLVKATVGYISSGTSHMEHPYRPFRKFPGPGIIKLQAIGSANDLDVSAGFDLILVDN